MIQATKSRPTIKPPVLTAGCRVGLLSPGSRPATPAVVQRCRRVLEEMQFEVVVGEHVLGTSGFMAGTDRERLQDLNGFLNDDSLAGIFFTTGGYGALHLVKEMDYGALERHPKVVLGCDDNTVLLNAIQARTGLVTFHGPNIEQVRSSLTFDRVKTAITSTQPLSELAADGSGESLETFGGDFFCAVEGDVEGRLVGGNLTALASLLGTEYEPVMRGGILLLEDVNEQNGILDRWFTSLYLGGHLQSVSGVAFGTFENCHIRGAKTMLSVMDLFADRLVYLRTPSAFGFSFGQNRNPSVVPIGVQARLRCQPERTQAGRLTFLESALF